MEYLAVHQNGPRAEINRILSAAKCKITDERSRSLGMVAYNCARLVWLSYESQYSFSNSNSQKQPNSIGRNDPCFCGSGQKYKKCCLPKGFDSQQIINQAPKLTFDAAIIPKIWDEERGYDDMIKLGELLREDPNLKKLRFTSSKVEKFLNQHRNDSEFFQDSDGDTKGQFIDHLAVQFARESREGRILEKATDLLLAAAKNARTIEELRALASGVVLAASYKLSGDADNPLTALIFRLTVKKVLEPISKMRNFVEGQASKTSFDDLDDTQRASMVMAFLKTLNKKEKKAIEKMAEDIQDDISRCLSEEKFPIGLPFATALPFWLRVSQVDNEGANSWKDEALVQIVNQCGESLTDDDYRLFLTNLEEWLDENKNQQDPVSDSVKMMHLLTKSKSLSNLAPQLLIETCRQNMFVFIDEEEIKMVDEWKDSPTNAEITRYATLLQNKGYPLIAERTKNLIQQH